VRIVFILLTLLAAAPALAQTAVLLRADTLRTEPYADAAAVSQAAAGDAVRLLQRKGNWSQVEAGGKQGWLRALNLRSEGAAALKREGVLAMETGRKAQGGVSVPLAVRSIPPGPAARLLDDIFEAREKPRTVELSARRAADGALTLDVQSPAAGYAYVFMAGATGETLQCLFPNAVQPDNDVAPGKALHLPAGGWRIGPEGAVRLLTVVTETPLDMVIEGKQAEGPLFKLSVTAANRAALRTALSGGGTYGAARAAIK
jgi:uncharacterized protein YgiM (DUF1202 family)